MLNRLPTCKITLQELAKVLAEKINRLKGKVFAGLLINAFI